MSVKYKQKPNASSPTNGILMVFWYSSSKTIKRYLK